jgi:hypothetical protein
VRLVILSVLLCGQLALAQNTVSIALNYNFNGIAHVGETGQPDASNGFRAISDRALDFTGGLPGNPVFTRFSMVTLPGVLDMVHLGNRNTVANGNWAFEASPNGNNVGVQPSWLASVNQSGAQATTLAAPIAIGINSSASVLFHVSNGGGSCDVTFHYASGQSSVHSITAPDWFGGSYAGRDSVDQANAGANLGLAESVIDLSGDAGETLNQITFSNRSNTGAGYGIYAVNVEAEVTPQAVNHIALQYNWNGIVHSGEALQPDLPNGYRSIADRGLDFTAGVPSQALLAEFELIAVPGVLDMVMLGNRNAVAGGSLAFDVTPDGDDIGVQPTWLPAVDLTVPQTTTLSQPILLDASSRAEVLFQTTHGGGVFDVTFTFATGSITTSMRGGDWVGGVFVGRANVDSALPGLPLHIERQTVDLGPLAGFVLTGITFSNFSNPNGSCAILAANVGGCLACANAGSIFNHGGGGGATIQTTATGALGCGLDWTVSGANPSTPFALWAIGIGTAPLPLSLLFAPCTTTLHVVNAITASALVDAFGTTTFALPLVTDPVFCGTTITAQLAEIVAQPCPLLLSDALSITIGN